MLLSHRSRDSLITLTTRMQLIVVVHRLMPFLCDDEHDDDDEYDMRRR